jgi:hypothetical protein
VERTAEARWFFPGRASPAQVAWFVQKDRVRREAKRIDRYLDLAGCATLGIKQRQGKLELKARTAPPRLFKLAGVAGYRDQWGKSSLSLGNTTRLAGRWVPVAKARMVLPQKGCDVELARIEAFGRRYFSLGFEAVAPAALERTLARFFAARGAMPGTRIAPRYSLSYPVWLASVAPAFVRAGRTPSPGRRGSR